MQGFSKFLDKYRVRTYKKGEIILFEGQVPPVSYVVKSGVIKTYNITAEGQEKPISFETAFELFPVAWVFKKMRQAQYFYEAFSDAELYCVPRDDVLSYLRTHPDLLFDYFGSMLKQYLNFQMRVNALEQSKAVDKVIHTLHFLALRFGKEMKSDLVQIQLPLTQQDMANIMGLTRETTGIELKKLERAGVIHYRRQNYLIRTDKLNELLDVDYSGGKLVED